MKTHFFAILMSVSLLYPGCSNDEGELSVKGFVYKHSGGGISVEVKKGDSPVSGADISVNNYRLHEIAQPGEYLITENTIEISPGVLYNLEVAVDDIYCTSSTTLPDTNFGIIYPLPDSIYPSEEDLIVIWSSSDSLAQYIIHTTRLLPEIAPLVDLSPVLNDTTYTISGDLLESSSYNVYVFAFRDGMQFSDDIDVELENNMSNGVKGYFGSWVQKQMHVQVE